MAEAERRLASRAEAAETELRSLEQELAEASRNRDAERRALAEDLEAARAAETQLRGDLDGVRQEAAAGRRQMVRVSGADR